MEAVVVGVLTAIGAVVAVLLWQLLVRPDALLSVWSDGPAGPDTWSEHHPGAVRALTIAAGCLIFLLGLFTGMALTFLQGTHP